MIEIVKEKRNETDIAIEDFGAKIKHNDLDTNKIYCHFMFRTYFIEFEDMETVEKWKAFCEKNIHNAFYDAMATFNLKDGERNSIINKFIKELKLKYEY